MTLYVDRESEDFRFYKTLNEDVQLQPVSSKSKHWDIQMQDGDYVNVTGHDSLNNAICIAIMTRFNELDYIPLYEGFGCRIHELIKANKSEMVRYKIELFIIDVLKQMRRIKEVNWIEVEDNEKSKYYVRFSVKSINDTLIEGSVTI
ncbi:hypothetical protein [Methanobrevibacter sp.]